MTSPTNDDVSRLLGSAARAEFRTPVHAEGGPRTLLVVTGQDLTDLLGIMRLSSEEAAHCMCPGDMSLVVIAPDGTSTEIRLHHGYTMFWPGAWTWPDAKFEDPQRFMSWLAARGVTKFVDDEKESLAQEAAERAQRERWVTAAPWPVQPWLPELEKGTFTVPAGVVTRAMNDLSVAIPELGDRTTALLRWYGSGVGEWSGYPSYESVAAAFLDALGTQQIVNAIAGRQLDGPALSGLARHFTSHAHRKERRKEFGAIPEALREQMLAHVRANLGADHVAAIEAVLRASTRQK